MTQVEIDGIQMGILSNGSPYLTSRGLARMSGIDSVTLLRMSHDWPEEQKKPRGAKIKELLAVQGYQADSLFLRVAFKGQ